MIHLRLLLQRQPAYVGYSRVSLPEAEHAAREVLSLPLYPSLSEKEVKEVAEAVNESGDRGRA